MADPKRFRLVRDIDVTGASGTGIVAHGVLWPDGTVSIRWAGDRPSIVHWGCLEDAEAIHGHGGATSFVWLDSPNPPPHVTLVSEWRQLRGYVEAAVNDGGTLTPANVLTFMDELYREGMAPLRGWMDKVRSGDTGGAE